MEAARLKANGTRRLARVRALLIAAAVFAVEVAIGTGVIPGEFVRHSVGDVLVVPLIHFVLRGALGWPLRRALAVTLAISFAVEALQYVQIADRLGFARGSLASILIGTTFSALDLLMYAIGGALAAALDVLLLSDRSESER